MLEKFGALWKGKPGSKAVLAGKLEDGRRVLIFKNERKEKDSQPDYTIQLATDDDKPAPVPAGDPLATDDDDQAIPF